MRRGVLQRITSRLLGFAGLSLLVPMLLSLVLADGLWWAYAVPMASALLLAVAFAGLRSARQAPGDSLRRREGFLAVTLGWLILVLFTAFAYSLSGAFAGFAECFFESMSGFTTTGATVARDVEILPASVLFHRAFTHWVGGMGIVVLSVAILPELAVGGMQLYAAESSGIDNDKLAPRIATTARRLWGLYFVITLLLTFLLLLGGMDLFDSVTHSMATIATGGFSTRNASVAAFDSVYIEVVITIFMFLSGINFTLQYRAFIRGQAKALLNSVEVRLYTAITLIAIALLTVNLVGEGTFDRASQALRHASFQVVSIITTTGFITYDFDTFPDFSRVVLVVLMVIGGCAGSTAGGSKVVRLYVIIKHALIQLSKLVRPRVVQTLQIGDREVPRETTEGILGFYLLYFAAIVVGGLAMTALGMDLVSGTTAAVSAMNSVGPGLGTVGGIEPFADVPDAGLYLLSFGMLLGRLEIYTVLVLFTPYFWRRG